MSIHKRMPVGLGIFAIRYLGVRKNLTKAINCGRSDTPVVCIECTWIPYKKKSNRTYIDMQIYLGVAHTIALGNIGRTAAMDISTYRNDTT